MGEWLGTPVLVSALDGVAVEGETVGAPVGTAVEAGVVGIAEGIFSSTGSAEGLGCAVGVWEGAAVLDTTLGAADRRTLGKSVGDGYLILHMGSVGAEVGGSGNSTKRGRHTTSFGIAVGSAVLRGLHIASTSGALRADKSIVFLLEVSAKTV